MADKALIALHGARQDAQSVTRESDAAASVGCSVETVLPYGVLVSGTLTQFSRLVALGFWVRVFRETNLLRVGRYRIDIASPPPIVPPELEVPAADAATWPHHLVQLTAPPTPAWIKDIEAAGATIITRVPDYGLVLSATPGQMAHLETLPFVAWRGPFKPAYRLARSLESAGPIVRDLVVLAHPVASVDEVSLRIEALGGTVVSRGEYKGFARIVATLGAQHLNDLATLPPVFTLEYAPPDIVLLDERTCQIVAGGSPASMGAPGYDVKGTFGVDGTGVSIAIVDTGVDANHRDFLTLAGVSRFTHQEAADNKADPLTDCLGHGTAVAGVAAGNAFTVTNPEKDSAGFALGQGIAPEASLISLKVFKDIGSTTGWPVPVDPNDVGGVGGVGDWATRVHSHGAHVMNNSWEQNTDTLTFTNAYTDVCRHVDDAVRGLPIAIVCGAGNTKGADQGPVRAPGVAKNVITVGASRSSRPPSPEPIDTMWPDSRSGPSLTNRLLPTLAAPGTFIVSAQAKCGEPFVESVGQVHALGGRLLTPGTISCVTTGGVGGKHGTSYAVPHVAGACALLIESWQERTAGAIPSPALLKAWLINGATDVGGTTDSDGATTAFIPNNSAGWGRVSLATTLRSDGVQKLFVDQTFVFRSPADEYVRRVTAIDPAKPVRTTLVWTDPPVVSDEQGVLTHNLDLELLEESTGQRFLGNLRFANGFSGAAAPSDLPDSVDNVECVYVQLPNGIYTVRVTLASGLLPGEQPDFALVIDNVEEVRPSPVNIALLLDLSSSMSGSGYEEPARRAANSFIGCLRAGDEAALVTFADAAAVNYPLTSINEPARIAARAAVDAAAFGGCTSTGGGIQQAKSVLAAAANPANPAAIMLLSDGYDNQGCLPSPGPPTGAAAAAAGAAVPIHACALGPASEQLTMQELAATTGGRYYFAPGVPEMQEVCGYVSADLSGDGVAALETVYAAQNQVFVAIDGSVTSVTFQATWANAALGWIPETIKRGKIKIDLIDPRGRRVDLSLCHVRLNVRPGCLTAGIEQPLPGLWTVSIGTVFKQRTPCSVAAYVRSPQMFSVDAAQPRVPRGAPIVLTASGFVAPAPKGWKTTVKARASRPAMTLSALETKHPKLLHKQSVPTQLKADQIPVNVAKLIALDRARVRAGLPGLFKSLTSSLSFVLDRPSDTFKAKRLTPTIGTYNFVVTAEARGPVGSTPIVRKKMVSVLVVP